MLPYSGRKILSETAKGIFLIVLLSCQELSGNKPLSRVGQSKIDTGITGVWKYTGCTNYNHFNMTVDSHYLYITPFNQHEYVLCVYNSYDTNQSSSPILFRAFISRCKDKNIANVQLLFNKTSHEYVYYPFTFSKDTLCFWGYYTDKVSSQVSKQHSYKSFILQHFADTNFFSSYRIYVRSQKDNTPIK